LELETAKQILEEIFHARALGRGGDDTEQVGGEARSEESWLKC
jgi:hypothetical protein